MPAPARCSRCRVSMVMLRKRDQGAPHSSAAARICSSSGGAWQASKQVRSAPARSACAARRCVHLEPCTRRARISCSARRTLLQRAMQRAKRVLIWGVLARRLSARSRRPALWPTEHRLRHVGSRVARTARRMRNGPLGGSAQTLRSSLRSAPRLVTVADARLRALETPSGWLAHLGSCSCCKTASAWCRSACSCTGRVPRAAQARAGPEAIARAARTEAQEEA